MAYVRRHWVDYPDTSTPIDADALNNIEDGIEESHNIQLLAVTDTAPSECVEGDKYFDTTTNLIYTATGTNEWGETGETPIYDILYIVLDEQTSYTYNGTTLVSVGGGSSTGGGETLKIGTILPFSGSTLPTGYLFCDGSAISRTTYAGLFAVIGTAFGAGDGSTTFNLPNLNGRVPVGQDSNDTDFDTLGETGGEKTHTLTVDEMPSHNHNGGILIDNAVSGGSRYYFNSAGATNGTNFSNSLNISNTGGGQAHNNVQPYVVVNYIIKATQTTPTQAQIINEYSDSTTDGYSANYVNNLANKFKFTKTYTYNGTNMSTTNGTVRDYSSITIHANDDESVIYIEGTLYNNNSTEGAAKVTFTTPLRPTKNVSMKNILTFYNNQQVGEDTDILTNGTVSMGIYGTVNGNSRHAIIPALIFLD